MGNGPSSRRSLAANPCYHASSIGCADLTWHLCAQRNIPCFPEHKQLVLAGWYLELPEVAGSFSLLLPWLVRFCPADNRSWLQIYTDDIDSIRSWTCTRCHELTTVRPACAAVHMQSQGGAVKSVSLLDEACKRNKSSTGPPFKPRGHQHCLQLVLWIFDQN